MSGSGDDLAQLWEWFAVNQFRGYSPLYERIALAVAVDDEVLGLVRQAPPTAHLPPVLLGAVHFLMLASPGHPLAEVYAGRSGADPVPLFLEVCHTHGDRLTELLSFRQVQTTTADGVRSSPPGCRGSPPATRVRSPSSTWVPVPDSTCCVTGIGSTTAATAPPGRSIRR